MATIDYKQKIKDYMNSSEVDTLYKSMLSNLFPELKESEDEKIRKEIISALKYANYKGVYDKHLAWLEKQGEQNATELSNICEYSLETWIKIVDFVLTEHNGIGNYLDSYETKDTAEKLREKYKFDAASEEWDRVYRKGLDAGVNKGKAIALKEQKPAWSEEDDRMMNDTLAVIDWYAGKHKNISVKLSNWLKSIKNRVQPKQEWSEEDETYLDHIITAIKSYYTDDKGKENPWREELLRWLESLKDRYTWKPSDEQIKALNEAIYHVDDSVATQIAMLIGELSKL